MDVTILLQSGGVLAALGIFFGLLLGFASKAFYVEVDERVEAVRELLPGANCGGCGVPSCDSFAQAAVSGQVQPADCVANSRDNITAICKLLGMDEQSAKKRYARIICRGTYEACPDKMQYAGLADCRAAMVVSQGQKGCRFSCLGMGNCVKVCPFGAMYMGDDGLPVVVEELCTGCGVCVKECPRNVIKLMGEDKLVRVRCSSEDVGKAVRDVCSNGCITCRMCERTCKFDAVHVNNNKARMDFTKCVFCMECAEKCPTKAIEAEFAKRPIYWIDPSACTGNGACREACPFDAIIDDNGKSIIDPEKCHGCGMCAPVCPQKAISTTTEQLHA
ncbi:RnfABCDGE type electron transport complex subunit B [Eubacteriales bacterium OttesenSCG-928-N14]|nr:RnfABCDGE type electron transport complex subunit B [Eubacteriales bacterium OttesenSCG-928-N14]